jgi:hypothetical protein
MEYHTPAFQLRGASIGQLLKREKPVHHENGQPAVCSAISNAGQKYPKIHVTESTTNVHFVCKCVQLI